MLCLGCPGSFRKEIERRESLVEKPSLPLYVVSYALGSSMVTYFHLARSLVVVSSPVEASETAVAVEPYCTVELPRSTVGLRFLSAKQAQSPLPWGRLHPCAAVNALQRCPDELGSCAQLLKGRRIVDYGEGESMSLCRSRIFGSLGSRKIALTV